MILSAICCIFGIIVINSSYAYAYVFNIIPSREYFFPIVGIRIDGGQKYTNSTTVTVEIKSLKLPDSLVMDMRVGTQPDLSGAEWTKYNTDKFTINLTPGDGDKYVYAQLKDKAGNISPVESNIIILDTTPPEKCRFVINQGERYTNDQQKRVVLFIQADEDISQMMFSNSSDFNGAQWEPFAVTKNWLLPDNSPDGEKTVYGKFMDPAGNISKVVTASIILDTQPPTNGNVEINNGDKYTRTPDVKLKIQADGASLVRIVSPDKSEVLPFQPVKGSDYMEVNWQFDSLQGTKVVRVFFQDSARNRTTQIIQDDIIYDSVGPVPPYLSINGDSKYANDPQGIVNLKITTRVNPSEITMEVSNYIDFHDTQPQPFKDNIPNWQLLGKDDGLKTIYARFFDQAGNASDISSAKIILDRVPPKVNSVTINDGGKWTTSLKVVINMDVDGAAFCQISNTDIIAKTLVWDPFQPKRVDWSLIPGDGEKIVYTRFKDAAGNMTDIIKTSVNLDTKPPTGEVSIDNGSRFTNRQDKIVHIQLKSPDAKGMQISNTPDFSNAKLEPFSTDVINWTLDGDDGPKTIFVRFKDEAGNLSPVYNATIILDRQPPSDLSIILNEGQEWLRNPSRRSSVQLNANGAAFMELSENPNFPGESWAPFKNVTYWIFSPGEGDKELFARFKDAAGNISQTINGKIKLDFTPPVCDTFNIDNGNDFTNNAQKKVTLDFSVRDAVKMTISNSPIQDPTSPTVTWEDYKPEKDWILDGEDGVKTVYAVFKDEAGNYSALYSDKIILDRVGPTNCNVVFNNNMKWVPPGGNKITLDMTADGADKMIISEDPTFKTGRWELFIPRKVFEVSKGDGEKDIYVKFKDKAGNESQVISGKVFLDTSPPTPISLSIDDGAKYTNNPSKTVKLEIMAKDALEMRISQKGGSAGTWEPYVKEKSIVLDGNDGNKVIGVFFRDEAGNISNPLLDSIDLDRKPPVPVSFIIGDSTGYTKSPDKKVELHIMAQNAQFMMISDKPSFEGAQWIKYSTDYPDYVLPGDDGDKVLFIKFKDETGNESAPISAHIILKRSF